MSVEDPHQELRSVGNFIAMNDCAIGDSFIPSVKVILRESSFRQKLHRPSLQISSTRMTLHYKFNDRVLAFVSPLDLVEKDLN